MADSQNVVGEVLVAWEKYTATGPDELNLKAGDVVELLDTNDPQSSPKRQKLDPDLDTIGSQTLDNSAAKHKLSVKPKRTHKSSRHSPTRLNVHARWLVREVSGNRRQGWVPCRLLQTIDDPTLGSSGLPGDAVFRRQAVVKELVETEQEFVKDLDYFVSHYLFGSQAKKVPKVVRDNFEGIFTNLKELAEFHRGVLMEGVKYYQNEPHLLGKAFLRLERDFDKHANYCQDEPLAQQILESSEEARIYFDALTKKLRDDKSISEHLKLPIQRINDYQLLLKELVRYSTCLNEDTTNLHKALELMLSVPSRAEDDKFTQSIEGYPGSIHKLGRLIAHDWFSIVLREAEKKERYLFLFKGRILICKVRRISDDRSVFQLKDTIRLPQVEVKDHPEDNFTFELVEKTAGHSIILTAHRDQTKELWLNEIREFAKDFGDKDFLSPPGDEAKSPEKEPEKPEQPKKNPQIEVTSPEPKKQDKLQEELKQKLESRKKVNPVIEEKTEKKEKVLETKTVEVLSSKEEKPIIEEPKTQTVETKTSNPEPESEKSETLDPKSSNPGIEIKKPEPEKLEEVTEKVEDKNTEKESDTTGAEPKVTEPSSKPKKSKKEPSVKRPITPQPPEEDDHHLKRIKAVEPLIHLNNPRILEEVLPYKPKPYVEPQGSALQKLYTVDSVPLGETVVAADYSVAFEVNVEIGDTDMSRRYTSARGADSVESSYSRKSTQSSHSTDGYTSKYATAESSLSGGGSKYEELSSKYGSKDGKSYEGDSALSSSYTRRTTSRTATDIPESDLSYTRKSRNRIGLDDEVTSYSRKIRDEDDYAYSTTKDRKYDLDTTSPLSPLPGESLSYTKRYVSSEAAIGVDDGDGFKYSKRSAHAVTESVDDGGSMATRRSVKYSREGSDREPESNEYSSYSKRAYSSGRTAAITEADEASSKYSRRSAAASTIIIDDDTADLYEKYSPRYSRSTSRTQEPEEEDVYAKYTRKYSRNSSYNAEEDTLASARATSRRAYSRESSRTSAIEEDDPYTRYKRKYSRTESKDNKESIDDVTAGSKKYSRTDSKDYKESIDDITAGSKKYSRTDSRDYKDTIDDITAGSKMYSRTDSYGAESVKSKSRRGYADDEAETTVLKSQTIISSETSVEGGGISENIVEQKSARSEIKETSASKVESSSEKRSVQSEEKVTAKKEHKQESKEVKEESIKKESHHKVHSEEHHQKTATEKLVEMEDEHFDENKPRFIKTIRGANIEPGEITTFEVSLNAQPDTFAWLKDNKPVNGNGEMSGRIQMTHCDAKKEYKLVIKQTVLEDSGLYTAIASNDKGKTSCSAQLIVHELTTEERAERMTTDKPEFLVSLKDTELLEDTYLRFMVKVYGEPNPDITFYKDGTKIPENVERFQVIREQSHKGFYELVIPDVKHKDAGVYKCVATNKFGEASSEATVTVTDSKKVFDDMPEGEILPPGEKPVFQWKKDGLPFEPEERFKVLMGDDEDSLALVFQHVRPEDVGLYTCVAQTSRGHISCSAELTVHGTVNQLFREPEKPKLIIEKREPIVVNVGASAMMELQIKGYPKPQVKLTHDGKAVEAGSKYKILYEDEETLSVVIKNVQSEDAGKYTVVAENELGSDIGEMTVIVKEPSKMKTKLEDVSIHADEVLKMSVEVGGIPKPTVKFYKDGKELKQSERIKYVEEGEKYSLVIEKTNLKDSGSYSVVATNELAQVSEFNTLKVFSKPKLLEKLGKDKIVSQGDNFQMKVKVEAEPISEVTWYKDEEELTSGDHYLIKKEGDSYILKISGAVTTDAAKYKVKAVNIHGSVEDDLRVDVKKMPKITKELQNMTVTEHDTNVTFDVKLEAFPKPQVKWYLDEMEITETKTEFTRIESDDGVQLVIKEVNSDLRGQYTCKLSNECGEVETSAKLTVNCAPRIIRKLNDTTVEEGSTLHLEVEVDACPPPTVKWVRNGREINADARIKITRDTKRYENYNLAVSLIKYEEQGEYEVFITNSLGTVSCKSFVTVHKVGFSDANEETCKEPKKISVTEVEEEPQKAPEEEEPEKPKQSKLTIKKHDKPIVEEPLTPNLENTENKNVTDEFPFKKSSSVQIEEVEAAQKINETDMEQKKPKRGSISTKESIEVIEQDYKASKTIEETDQEHRELKRGISATKENIEIVEEPDSRKAKINDLLQEKKLQKALRHHSVSIEEIEPQIIKRKTSLRRESIVLIEEITELKQKAETTLDDNKQKGILATQESIESITEDTRAQKVEESSLEHRKPKRGSLAQTGSIEIVEETKPQQIEDSFTDDKKPKRGTMSQKESIEIIEETKPQKIDETSKKPKRGSMSQKESIELIEETKAHKIDGSSVEHTKSKRGSLAHKESIEITEENKPQKIDETTLEHKKPHRGSMSQKESMELIENNELTDIDLKRTKETEIDTKPEQKKGILSSQESIEQGSEKTKPQKPDETTLEPSKPKRGSLAHKESLELVEKSPEALPSLLDTNMKDGSRPESLDITYIVRGTSNPPPKAKWTLNGEEIVPDKDLRVSVSENGEEFKLEITNLKLKDAGEYQCAIFNPLGVVTQRAVLDVTPEQELRRPKIKQGLEDQTIIKKHSVTHKVVIIGEPTPEITWYFNGKKITEKQMEKEKMIVETEEHEIEETLKECSYSLTIPRCERSNQGTFSMKAKNKWGECESSAELTVILRPEIEGPTDVSVVPGEATEFEVIIQSNPAPEVTWSLGDKIIVPTEFIEIIEDAENEKYKLIFKNVLLSDGGYYKVTAKNHLGETTSEARLKTITEVPKFITGLFESQVQDGGDHTASVRAYGLPKPTIKWFRNGEPLVEDENHKIETHTDLHVNSTLTILNYNEGDVGLYKATATNVVGEAETSCRISMLQTPPTFGKRLDRSHDANEGEPLELKAKINGSPKPIVAWFKDGEPIKDDRVKTTVLPDGTVKLNIDNVTPEDSGAYKLVVKNVNGDTSCLCAVAVTPTPKRPKFTKCFKDTKLQLGEKLRLQAQISAYPPPEIKWLKDGLPIRATSNIHMEKHPDGTIALVIDCAKPENAGNYQVVVSNKLGELTGDAKVNIEKKPTKPEFVVKLKPEIVVEGFPVRLEVKAEGFPAPTIKWFRQNAEVISDNQHIKIVELADGTSALLLDGADQLRDALTYKAEATNDAGTSETVAPLSVIPAINEDEPESKPIFLASLKDCLTDEGLPFILEAPFSGNPVPSAKWTKDGVDIEPSDRVLMSCDGRRVGLKIDHALPSDAGVYTCSIENVHGKDCKEAKGIVHKVYMPPNFTQRFTDLQQLPSRDAKFLCRVTGVPQPDVAWTKDGEPIRESEKYRIKRDGDTCCLVIINAQPEDAGIFRATATNKEGQDVCTASLEVVPEIKAAQKIEPPVFLKRIGDTELYKGMTAKFTACASGIPEPEAEWYHNDQKIFPSTRIRMETDRAGLLRLSLENVDIDDIGKYSCKISNEHGSDICHANLKFDDTDAKKRPVSDQYIEYDKYKRTGAPMPLSEPPIISQMTDRHCTLSWRPSIPTGPRSPVTYQLEMCELPTGDWFTVRSGIRSCTCGVRNLEPFRDYKFRVRVENKYGISDPSPYALTHRQKLEPEPPKYTPYLPSGIDFRPETSPYFPKDFDIERPPHDNMAQAPRFLRQEHDTQYGVKDQSSNLFWYVYGYPKPRMTYYFNDELVDSGGRFDSSYTRNGQATLFINKMLDRDVGWYEAVARNEHGEARQRVRLEIAEFPTFIRRPEIQYVMMRDRARFEARIVGVPYPEIKWYKDWKPLASSSRIKITFIEPDTTILTITDIILKDEGLYSCSARNVAGSTSASAMLHVDENDIEYNFHTYSRYAPIQCKRRLYTDLYDIGDELGRGTQGITYHAVERLNGRNYAAKIMHGRSELKNYMYNELEMMNSLRHRKLISLHDSYEMDDTVAIIMELASGGELVHDYLLKSEYYTERDIAGFMRQMLDGLHYMHEKGYGHMGLTLGDLLLSHPGGDDLKIGDFGLTRKINMGHLYTLNFGMPEYVSPECASGQGVNLAHDMWSVGIITYILLSGRSPFRGANDMETLTNIRSGKWIFEDEWWTNISVEAKDFITRLLVYKQEDRMDVHTALRHSWLERADKMYHDEYRISSRYLSDYWRLYREWYDNASCRRWYRRRPLEGAFTHPSKMVYPPGESYTPRSSPIREKTPRVPKTWEDQLPSRSPLNYEIGMIKSESHYQNGPDTYLLQLRDVDFPVRLREYMKVAANRGPGCPYIVSDENGYDWRTPVIRERRRFTDVMDEEIDDERKARINRYGTDENSYSIRRLKNELGSRLDSYVEAEAYIESKQDGRLPFFREKPQTVAMQEGKDLELSCLAVGEPTPIVQWFKNDSIIAESHRIQITTDADGRSHFKLSPALSFDQGMYKVAARNKVGQTIARCRIVLGMVPDEPDSPEASQVSDTEILLTWKQPKLDGNSPVLCYSLEYKVSDGMDWLKKADNIDHEFYLMGGLTANTGYIFRLAARNAIGWSDAGVPCSSIMTKAEGAEKVQLGKAMLHLQQITDSGIPVNIESKIYPNYATESNPIEWQDGNLESEYNIISEISRGRFSCVLKAIEKKTDAVVVIKLLDLNEERRSDVDGEFAALRSLRHERIAGLIAAYRKPDSAAFILEKLQGADILTYLSSRHEYSEQTVVSIVSQVLDGLAYLHWRGLCHLDLQPDNIVMCGVRSVEIKLVDLGSAHRVTKLGNKVPIVGHPDYISPEVLSEEQAIPQTDIWSVGVLTYVMLSGRLPFRGNDLNETRQNILFVRYRFEHLFNEVSPEATRFLMLLFKRHPYKRPTPEECHENRWLLVTDFMIKKRERAVFLGNRLKEYSDEYHNEKSHEGDKLASKLGGKFMRSHSIQDELSTAP